MERWPPHQPSHPNPRHGRSPPSSQGYFELGNMDPNPPNPAFNSPPWEIPEGRIERPSPSQMYNSYGQSSASPSLSSLGNPSPEISYNPYTTSKTPLVSQVPARKSVGSASSIYTTSSKGLRRSDTHTENLVRQRSRMTAQWKVHYYMPGAMVLLFFMGIFGAIAHHLYYKSLDGKPAVNQLTKVRFGTAFAFFTKAMLVGACVIAYRQRIWHTLRVKAMTLGAIDSLFAAVEDPTMFGSWEMIRNAKLATIMALVCWLIPIAAVLSPASLTSNVELATNVTQCESVPTLNFSREGDYDFRRQDSYAGFSMPYYNTTQKKNPSGTYDYLDPAQKKAQGLNYYDYYDQPSKIMRKLSTWTTYNNKPVNSDDAQQNSCGMGWNCTYLIQFRGPGYKCVRIADGTDSPSAVIAPSGAPFNTSVLKPVGTFRYYANVDIGDYPDPQHGFNDTENGLVPPVDLGVFKAEPVLWIGHVISTNNPADPKNPSLIPKMFKCTHYEVDYTVHMNYTEGVQTATVFSRNFISPLINTTPIPSSQDGSNFTIPTSQIGNETDPSVDQRRYNIIAAYHALGSLFREFLAGTIEDKITYPLTHTDLSETRLVDQETSYPIDDLMNGTQSLYEDMILTLLSEPHLVSADNASVECIKTRHVNLFTYHAQGLWIGYAIVVAVAACCVIVGGLAIRENGVSSDTMFSRIMVTTRNPTLDKLSVGACLGGDPFPKALTRVKLRFGVLDEYSVGNQDGEDGEETRVLYGSPVEHCAFGTEGETKIIEKGALYAGLKEYRDTYDDDDLSGEESEENGESTVLLEKERDMDELLQGRRRRL